MSNVLLVNPHTPDFVTDKNRCIPIGLLYLGAVLKQKGNVVKLIDINNDVRAECELDNYFQNVFWKKIGSFAPDFVGVGCLFSGRFKPGLHIAQLIKEKYPMARVVFGGIHPTTFPAEILEEYNFIDYIILGEGEDSFVQLVEAYDKGKSELDKIDGIAFRDNEKIFVNKKTCFIKNLDSIPFPDYGLIDLKEYFFDTSKWHNPKGLPINIPIPIISSRGCPNVCTFCSMYLLHGRIYRHRSPKNVVDEIEWLYKKFGHRYFSFMDDNFSLLKKRAIAIANEIAARGLDIQFDTPNGVSVKTLDKEVIDALVEAGLVRISVAIESGSEYIRNECIKKDLPTKNIYDFFDIIKNHKQLAVKAYFVLGYPQETIETLNDTLEMIKKIHVKEVALYFVVPYPKTELFDYCKEHNCFIIPLEKMHDLEYFSMLVGCDRVFVKPHALSIDDLLKFKHETNKIIQEKNKHFWD